MLYRNAACIINTLTILILTIISSSADAQPDCSVLSNSRDRFICKKYGADKDWLHSVQKINPDTSLSAELLFHQNRLYIFEGKSNDNMPVKYELPAFYSIPQNTAFIGSYSEILAPVLLISEQNKGAPLKTTGPGNYLLADISISAQSSGQITNIFSSGGADYLEVSSVTFKSEGDYVPDDTSSENTYVLFLVTSPSEVFIDDSIFFMPNVTGTKAQITLSAVSFDGEGDEEPDESIKVKYSDNAIISENYNKYASNLAFRALVASGNVEIADHSSCNFITTRQGNDLLSNNSVVNNSDVLAALNIRSTKSGALGFTNGYAWGWIANNHSKVNVSYETWDYWSKQSINTQCSQKPTSDSKDHSGLAVRITVPTVTVSVIVVVSIIGVVLARKLAQVSHLK